MPIFVKTSSNQSNPIAAHAPLISHILAHATAKNRLGYIITAILTDVDAITALNIGYISSFRQPGSQEKLMNKMMKFKQGSYI